MSGMLKDLQPRVWNTARYLLAEFNWSDQVMASDNDECWNLERVNPSIQRERGALFLP